MFLNLRDFGAVGDGAANDTAALNALLEEAARTGAEAWVPAGTYRIDPVKMPGGVTLRGSASWGYSAWGYENNHVYADKPTDPAINGNTVFRPASAGAEAMLEVGSGSRIIGLSFDGELLGENFCGILARDAEDVVLEEVRVCHFTGGGVRMAGVRGFAFRRGLSIANTSHSIDITGSSRITVIDSQLAYNPGGIGLYGMGADDVSVTANRIEGGTGGVYLEGSRHIALYGNSFDSCFGPSVTFIGCEDASVTGSLSRLGGCNETGLKRSHFFLEKCRGISVMGNSFWKWHEGADSPRLVNYGIVIRELSDSIVAKNAMPDTAKLDLVMDLGGHRNCRIEANCGHTFGPEDGEETPEEIRKHWKWIN